MEECINILGVKVKVNVLILTGHGINAEKELAWAFEMAGGNPSIVHLEDIIGNKSMLNRYQLLAFPGGFSFGDHISSGRIFANIIKTNLADELARFVEEGKLIIGICNGFQIITKLGMLPDMDGNKKQTVSLINNDSGHFENRWVWVNIENNKSPWLRDMDKLYLPVRHGEGKFVTDTPETLNALIKNKQVAMKYINPNSSEVNYPFDPNGSVDNIAGILNRKGNILGLMPHPEAYIFKEHHPRWTEKENDNRLTGLKIFQNGIDYFR